MITKEKTKQRLPEWFKQTGGKLRATRSLSKLLDRVVPNSICQEAKCPNRAECFNNGVLTFMVLGTTCTRNCRYCSVSHGKPKPADKSEIETISHAIHTLNLRFVVMTSPNRDDLPDGGASHYAYLITEIRKRHPHVKIEVLIPDFQGNLEALKQVMDAAPNVLNHNMETVPSLYTTARKGALFNRSLSVLSAAKKMSPNRLTKTGLMVGLGETTEELVDTFKEIKEKGQVDILTLGQYLKPDSQSLDVEKYYHPNEFEALKIAAEKLGFRYVFSGPFVRSSYLAEHVFDESLEKQL